MSYASIRKLHRDAMPVPGLPAPLPDDETLLWQGSPQFRSLLFGAFHLRALLLYFGAILTIRGATVFMKDDSMLDAVVAVLWIVPLFTAALLMVCAMAWLTCQTTVYTVTSKRVVMQIGVVLDLTFNLPFNAISSVGLRLAAHGDGDLPIKLLGPDKIAYLHLWPHARPWRLANPEPMMRSVADVVVVGELLADALRAHIRSEGRVDLPAISPTTVYVPDQFELVS